MRAGKVGTGWCSVRFVCYAPNFKLRSSRFCFHFLYSHILFHRFRSHHEQKRISTSLELGSLASKIPTIPSPTSVSLLPLSVVYLQFPSSYFIALCSTTNTEHWIYVRRCIYPLIPHLILDLIFLLTHLFLMSVCLASYSRPLTTISPITICLCITYLASPRFVHVYNILQSLANSSPIVVLSESQVRSRLSLPVFSFTPKHPPQPHPPTTSSCK